MSDISIFTYLGHVTLSYDPERPSTVKFFPWVMKKYENSPSRLGCLSGLIWGIVKYTIDEGWDLNYTIPIKILNDVEEIF